MKLETLNKKLDELKEQLMGKIPRILRGKAKQALDSASLRIEIRDNRFFYVAGEGEDSVSLPGPEVTK